jgi:hypothetical protein
MDQEYHYLLLIWCLQLLQVNQWSVSLLISEQKSISFVTFYICKSDPHFTPVQYFTNYRLHFSIEEQRWFSFYIWMPKNLFLARGECLLQCCHFEPLEKKQKIELYAICMCISRISSDGLVYLMSIRLYVITPLKKTLCNN